MSETVERGTYIHEPKRRCSRCNVFKGYSDFNIDRKTGRLQRYCKECHAGEGSTRLEDRSEVIIGLALQLGIEQGKRIAFSELKDSIWFSSLEIRKLLYGIRIT